MRILQWLALHTNVSSLPRDLSEAFQLTRQTSCLKSRLHQNDGGKMALYHIRIPNCVIYQSTTKRVRILQWLALHTYLQIFNREFRRKAVKVIQFILSLMIAIFLIFRWLEVDFFKHDWAKPGVFNTYIFTLICITALKWNFLSFSVLLRFLTPSKFQPLQNVCYEKHFQYTAEVS